MAIKLDKIKALQQNNCDNVKNDVSLLASCELMNEIGHKNSSSFRLSPAAKRMLILKRLDTCKSDRDFALLMRLLNDIDAAEDKSHGGLSDKEITLTWAAASDAEVVKDS